LYDISKKSLFSQVNVYTILFKLHLLITRKELKKMSDRNFKDNAYRLVGQEVEVITSEGTYQGTLLSVGNDSLVLQTRIRGRLVRLIIRLALIVALFRLIGPRGAF
jgi:hypothetical protein